MASTFFGLETGVRGLLTHQQALEVTGQNMTNSSTPGYSRQRAEITATDPFTEPAFTRPKVAGQMGTGSEVTEVIRIRDQIIDQQIQQQTTTQGYWNTRQDVLGQAERIVNEPADSNIRSQVDAYWVALQELAKTPESQPTRSTLRQTALTLTQSIRENYTSLKDLRSDTNDKIVSTVTEINRYADEIAHLNKQIGEITALDDHPNDLMDKRDQLVEELSKDVNINTSFDKLNRITIQINGIPLVNGDTADPILALSDNNKGMVHLEWSVPKHENVVVTNGNLAGLLQLRDQDLPKLMDSMDSISKTLINETNQIHKKGFGLDKSTGVNFFKGSSAADIDVSEEIQDPEKGLNKIAASSNVVGLPGNNETAQQMADLQHKLLMLDDTSTMDGFLGNIVGDLAEKSLAAQTNAAHQNTLLTSLDNRRQSVSGVNLDEETANMVKFQHGYNAAAKVVSTMDAMLGVIINDLKVSP
ncbi:MAG TPA: flagellar hook-associated protein FlgK [Firmicutes bacterium]|jgi:flagellar hook-associated protein 1|nr:flagellar hook-associated protein FlgK [Bacillota bacterium]